MNKARPLLLERPGFFSAVRRGGAEGRRWAGKRVAARRGRELLRGGGESCCEAGERRALYCGARCAARLTEASRATQGTGGTVNHTGTPHKACRGTPERTGHHRPRKGTPGRAEAPQGARRHRRARRDTPERARGTPGRMGASQTAQGAPQGGQKHRKATKGTQGARGIPGRTGHPRAHGASQGAQGHCRAHGGTEERTGAPQGVQGTAGRAGHRRACRDTSERGSGTPGRAGYPPGPAGAPLNAGRREQAVCLWPKKGPAGRRPKGAKEPFFALRKKF